VLLMACLMKLGSLPAARNPDSPTAGERAAIEAAVEVISVFSIRIEDHDPVFVPARSILDRAIRSKSCEWKSVLIKTSTCLLLRLVFCAVRGHLVAVR
jgi:hypothetical protein